MAAEKFVGKWHLISSENFDEYMKKIGIGFVTRKMACTLKPVLTIEINGDSWKMTSVSTFKTTVTEFKLGEEFEETTPDGRLMKSTFKLEGGKLVQEQKPTKSEDKGSRFERWVDGDDLTVICECEDVKCTRVYQREK